MNALVNAMMHKQCRLHIFVHGCNLEKLSTWTMHAVYREVWPWLSLNAQRAEMSIACLSFIQDLPY